MGNYSPSRSNINDLTGSGGITYDTSTLHLDDDNNRIGIGDTAPGTQLQIKGTAPYVTLQNSTVENSDGGCESKILFEDHANVALAGIQGSHDGTADDTKGDLILLTHNGSALTEAMRINSSQFVYIPGAIGHKRYVAGTLADGTNLATTQSGITIFQSTNGATVNLPSTSAGLIYTFVWTGAAGQTFNIDTQAADKIMGSIIDVADGNVVTAASNGGGVDGKQLQLDSGSKRGDRVTLIGDGSSGWIIIEGLGSWVFES